MSAVYNNVRHISDEQLEKLAKSKALDPVTSYIYNIENRLRKLEKIAEQAPVMALETINEELELSPANTVFVVQKSGNQANDMLISEVLKHYTGLVEENDGVLYVVASGGTVITPSFEVADGLNNWIAENAQRYLGMNEETFEEFWE